MPRFFVDFRDGELLQPDDIGTDVEHFQEVRDAAVAMLPQIARDSLPDGEYREFSVIVRDAQGIALYRATLTFHGEHLANAAA